MAADAPRHELIPRQAWPGLARRFGIVATLAVLMGLCSWALMPGQGLHHRPLDVSLAYTVGISLASWFLVDVGRFLMRGPLRADPPGCWPAGWRAVPLVALGMFGGYALGTLAADLYAGQSTLELLWLNPNRFAGLMVGSLIISGLFVLFFYQRGQAEVLQHQAREAELRLLQSQLEPHMLFNTLANLRVLIGLDPARAQAMLDRLISFLRATLSASRQSLHPLGAEFAHLEDYLALMAVRMGPRLRVALELPDELRALPLPPLLLQPLVENAIKHGLEPQVDGGRIEVRAQRQGQRLVLTVRDTGVGLPAADSGAGGNGGSFGLQQVRKRLATLHGGAAELRLQRADDAEGGTLAAITLPLPPPST